MARLIHANGAAVTVPDEKAARLLSLGFRAATPAAPSEPKPARRRAPKKKSD